MSVTRYDMERVDYEYYEMVAYEYGDYVKFDDYEALETDFNILRRDYEKLQQGIRDLYLES